MKLSIFTFPEIPENFKIPENPWLFHDCGNPGNMCTAPFARKLDQPLPMPSE